MPTAPATVIHHIKAGKLRGLATTSPKRLPGLEDVPTFVEAGFPAVEGSAWYGVLAPRGTPQPIVAKLHGELVRILQLPEIKERFANQGYDAVTCSPDEFIQIIKKDLARWQKVVKASGARVD